MNALLIAATLFLLFCVVSAKALAVHRIRQMRQELKQLVVRQKELRTELDRRREAKRQLQDQHQRKTNRRLKIERLQVRTERQIQSVVLEQTRRHQKKYATLGMEARERRFAA